MKSEWLSGFPIAVLLVGASPSVVLAQQKPFSLAVDKLELRNVKAESVTYQGRAAVRVTDAGPQGLDDADRLAIVPGSSFQDDE